MSIPLTIFKNHQTSLIAYLERLNVTHLDAICHLQKVICEEIADPQTYVPFTQSELQQLFDSSCGHILGVITSSGDLAAVGIYKALGQSIHNYGRDFGIEGSKLETIAQVDTTIVASEFRGNHLQQILIQKMEEIALKEGMHMLCATVSPINTYSLNNFLNTGYEIKADLLKYEGLRRYVVAKELLE